MSFWPGEKLRYAETHFKFKLPWSLLYKPWPEITFDMPFQAIPGEVPQLWIVVRDADRFPVTLESAEISITRTDAKSDFEENRSIPLDKTVNTFLEFVPIPIEGLAPGKYSIVPKITASRQTQNGKKSARTFTRWNLPTLKPQPIRIQILANDVPKGEGFVQGEMHCHTHYSRDHVEYGATPAVLQQAAKCIGLDFVSCTDHAYDFAFTESDYTKEADSPAPRFQKLRNEIAQLPQGNGNPLMLAGEEVSAGNSKGENVHMTVLAPDGYLPGLGDCGRYWLENKPTRKIPQLLESTTAHCFAAHPFQPMGLLEKFIFRRGYWKHEDLNLEKSHKIRGIQFWYPEQTWNDPTKIIPYKPTIRQSANSDVQGVTLSNLTFYGEYMAMDFRSPRRTCLRADTLRALLWLSAQRTVHRHRPLLRHPPHSPLPRQPLQHARVWPILPSPRHRCRRCQEDLHLLG